MSVSDERLAELVAIHSHDHEYSDVLADAWLCLRELQSRRVKKEKHVHALAVERGKVEAVDVENEHLHGELATERARAELAEKRLAEAVQAIKDISQYCDDNMGCNTMLMSLPPKNPVAWSVHNSCLRFLRTLEQP